MARGELWLRRDVLSAPEPQRDFCLLPRDGDYDGNAGCIGDCDDENPNISPFATATCNGLDDNCDGNVDEVCP